MTSQVCDVKDCINNFNQILVVHHCEFMHSTSLLRNCKFDPYENKEDKLHCIIRFCDRYADKFRKEEGSRISGKSKIQFKDNVHKHG